jgi:uncharacterized membrane protein HdeD (DUF308 family)
MATHLNRIWWVIAVRGLIGVLFGLAAFTWPGLTLLVLVALFGAYALIDGIFALSAAVTSAVRHQRWLAMLFEGVIGIAAGLVTFFLPGITALSLVFVIAAWALVTGALEILAAFRLHGEIAGDWLLGVSGALSCLLGVIMLFRPAAGALAFVWLVGAYALFSGILLLAFAFTLRRLGGPRQATAS